MKNLNLHILILLLFFNIKVQANVLNIDIAVTAIATPNITVPNCLVSAPKATIRNLGSSNQTSQFIINFVITGPVSYSDFRSDTLAAGLSRTIIFDSSFAPTEGSYTAIAFISSSTGDSNFANDTLKRDFNVNQNHFGGGPLGDDYFFANSTPCAFTSGYPFFWEDTTGSSTLISNGVIDTSIAKFTGDIDDGYFRLGNILQPGYVFRFFEINYDSIFISTNGIIALTARNNSTRLLDFTPDSIPNVSNARGAIFAFWKDLNFGSTVITTNRISFKVLEGFFDNKILITFDRAPNFGASNPNDYVSFQVILDNNPFPWEPGNFITIQYDDSQTGTTFLGKYFGNTLAAHLVGIQDTTGTEAIQYRRVTGTQSTARLMVAGPLFTSSVRLTIGGGPFPFPVEFLSFTSNVNRSDVLLYWTTASEFNNSGFDIERSKINPDGSGQADQWSKVGHVEVNGTSNILNNYSFTDRGLESGKFNYRLKQIDFNGNFEYFNLNHEVNVGVPLRYNLSQNYPNPFNPTTNINYDLPVDGKVSIKLFDISGREVTTLVNEVKPAGYYKININASNFASGVYFYWISAGNFIDTKRMVLVK